MFAFLLGTHLEVELLGGMATLCLTTTILFSKVAVPFNIPTLHYLHQHLLLSIIFIIAILVRVMWYLIVVVICIAFTGNGIEHLSLFIGHLCIFEEMTIQMFCPLFYLGYLSSYDWVVRFFTYSGSKSLIR